MLSSKVSRTCFGLMLKRGLSSQRPSNDITDFESSSLNSRLGLCKLAEAVKTVKNEKHFNTFKGICEVVFMKSTNEVLLFLKEIRKERNIKVEDVVMYLHENGVDVAVKTVYGWERGGACPSIQSFVLLCQFYGISDIYKLFSDDLKSCHDDCEMRALWSAYCSHESMQSAVNKLLDKV